MDVHIGRGLRKISKKWHLSRYTSRYKSKVYFGICVTSLITLVGIYTVGLKHSLRRYDLRIWHPWLSNVHVDVNSSKLCPRVSLDIKDKLTDIPKSAVYFPITELPNVRIGGIYRPKDCVSRYKAAIIIPFRDRDEHLKIFLGYIHPFLQRQKLEYTVFAVEQDQESKFNRAALMNVGFLEALKQEEFGCFIFHDVDLLPQNDLNIYSCSIYPRQLVHSSSEDGYIPKYETYFGGLTAITKDQMLSVNGYSNQYYGWGGEDDDFFERFVHNGYPTYRNSEIIGRYWELPHDKSAQTNAEQQSSLRKSYFARSFNWREDGLSTIKYHIRNKEERKLCTYMLVSLPKEEEIRTFSISMTKG